jgi:hypothetical protein
MKWIRSHLSFANTISLIALFVALGGTSLAAVSLSKNSVGAKQIKKDAVRASEIKRNAVGASEIRSNAVASGDVADNGIGGSDLSDNSVGAGELSDNSVGSSEVTNGSLVEADLAPGLLDIDPELLGPTAFARVQGDGTLEPGGTEPQFKGVDASDIQKAGVGIYCFGDLGFTLASAVVSMDNAGAAATTTQVASVAIQRGANLGGCDAGHQQARVAITNVDPAIAAAAAQDGRFTVWFMG